eukprot:jgi/Tetstr1/422604/TSEL_013410.t1
MAPTSCVPGPRKRSGHNVQRRPDGANQPRARRRAHLHRRALCGGAPMVSASCVPGPRKRPGHMVQRRPDGADQLRAGHEIKRSGHKVKWRRLDGANHPPGLRKQPGHMVQRRPDGADQLPACPGHDIKRSGHKVKWRRPDGTDHPPELRKQPGHMVQRRPDGRRPATCFGRGSDRSTWCSGGPKALTSCVPGPRKRSGHNVQRRPDGVDQPRARAAKATGAQCAAAARWRRLAACPGHDIKRSWHKVKWRRPDGGGLMAPTIRPGHGSDRGTTCSDGPMASTSRVPGLRRQPGHMVQRRPDGAD